ncbi:MAG: hypothetical protein JJ974_09915 [Phycisphaerales bacterium]|nr:hypothetical protein [Phycisphaerales bacterium]
MINQTPVKEWELEPITLSVTDMNLGKVLQLAAQQAGTSITVPSQAQQQTVTVEYTNQPPQAVFQDLARQMQLVAQYDGQIVTLIQPELAHKDFVVLRSGYADPEKVQNTMRAVLGQETSIDIIDDRLVVAGDQETLKTATEYARHLTQGPDAWMLQVRVVSITENYSRELGLDWSIQTNLGLNTTGPGYIASADFIATVIGKATETGTHAKLMESATLYVLEGTPATLNQGQRVPIPRFQTSPEGTTTTTGYDYIDAGFRLEAEAKRVPGGARLTLKPTISSVVGFVREAPITQESSVEVQAIIESGQWLVVSGLDSIQTTTDTKQIPGLPAPVFGTQADTDDNSRLILLVHAQRIYASNHQER